MGPKFKNKGQTNFYECCDLTKKYSDQSLKIPKYNLYAYTHFNMRMMNYTKPSQNIKKKI